MGRTIWISDDEKRDAQVTLEPAARVLAPKHVSPEGRPVKSERLIRSTEEHSYPALRRRFPAGEDLAKALIAGDPEIDLRQVGRRMGWADRVWLDPDGKLLYSARVLQVVYGPDGAEKSRSDFVDVEATVTDQGPLPWSGRLFPIAEVVRKFALVRAMPLRHVNGLTFDFLYGIAKKLHEARSMVLVGSGPKGVSPLIFVTNGAPYRGFLEGRVDGDRYLLLLHLSNLELKARPS